MNEKTDRITKLDNDKNKHSYVMTRSVKFGGILYEKGQVVKFTDKQLEKQFLHNNYIT